MLARTDLQISLFRSEILYVDHYDWENKGGLNRIISEVVLIRICARGPGGASIEACPTLFSPNAPELLLTWYVPTTIVQYVTRKIH